MERAVFFNQSGEPHAPQVLNTSKAAVPWCGIFWIGAILANGALVLALAAVVYHYEQKLQASTAALSGRLQTCTDEKRALHEMWSADKTDENRQLNELRRKGHNEKAAANARYGKCVKEQRALKAAAEAELKAYQKKCKDTTIAPPPKQSLRPRTQEAPATLNYQRKSPLRHPPLQARRVREPSEADADGFAGVDDQITWHKSRTGDDE